jgi:hypothetical protein
MGAPSVRNPQRRAIFHHPGGWLMSYEAVRWALYDAPMLRTPSGEPDTTARLVLVARAERADKKGRDTYAGPADVAAATGYDERTVKRADRRLEKAGLMIRDGYSRHGTTRWHLDMDQTQSDAEPSPVDERTERQRKANAERQRRFQERRRAAAGAGQSIEGDVSTKIGITLSNAVSNGVQDRDVTPFNAVTNGLGAPQTTHEPPRGTTTETTPGGAPPPDPRRPHSPSAPGTDEQNSLSDALTPAQDQQRNSLPHARPPNPTEHVAPVVELSTWRAS